MNIKIKNLEIQEGTEKLTIKNRLAEWLSDNFWKGNLAEITLEETE